MAVAVQAGLFVFCALSNTLASTAGEFRVSIRVDASRTLGEVEPIWRFFGYDEANYTYMPNGKKLLTELGELGGGQVYVRCHHLLTSGDGSPALKWGSTGAYTETADGTSVYDWTIIDRIFDTYLECGLKPYVEIGFMPEALSTHPEDYPRNPPPNELVPIDTGQAYPPRDYGKWAELVYQWTKHCVEKYGAAEVNQWYWGLWNEPNIIYWRGTREEYFKLYDYSVDAVRRALPSARVGGPESAHGLDGNFLRDFLQHCSRGVNYVTGERGAPIDFISFHAKGAPEFIDGHVRMGMGEQLRQIDDAFRVIASFEGLNKLPVIIGEYDPEGCAACRGPHNAYRNGTMYSSYTAAVFPRIVELAEKHNINLDGALTWAFQFEGQPPFAGFRALATDGIDLPVLNVFRMFAKMSGQRVFMESSGRISTQRILERGVRELPDISACSSIDGDKMFVMAWHYHDEDICGSEAFVELKVSGLKRETGTAKMTRYSIDATHSNSYAVWKSMGEPVDISPEQRVRLEIADQLATCEVPITIPIKEGTVTVSFALPRQAVTLLIFDLKD
ncbi:MAG: beta-xylosidase [Candidatus Hydrogenedentes bacterium]|nr:beta-xylosidase [Candidatus Hydrogenedentota bacterium]